MSDDNEFDQLMQDPEFRNKFLKSVVDELTGKTAKDPEPPQAPAGPDFDTLEAEEIAALPGGKGYADRKYAIKRKYTALRAQAANAPAPDPEIEKIKNDPAALMRLYKSRVAQISPRDPLSLRKKTEIASPFRKLGLNV